MIISRYRRIVWFFSRLLFRFIWWDLFLPRIGLGGLARKTRQKRLRDSAAALRGLAINMGGVLIKVGQFLSSRVDVLPLAFTEELAGLQDEVPPEDLDAIRRVAETEIGAGLHTWYSFFDEHPLAAASLGQVHRAEIRINSLQVDGDSIPRTHRVVVKIQRPNIQAIIATDLAALRTVGVWLGRYKPIQKRADIPSLLDEFTRILYEEIDYIAEGEHAEKFAENFQTDPRVKVPKVYWDYTTRRILTLEDVWGIKITEYEMIREAGIDPAEVAEVLLDVYLKQIFEDGFFHADPHPGNLFVSPLSQDIPADDLSDQKPEPDWQLTFVDFGMVGWLPDRSKEGLREMLIGVGTRDARRLVASYQSLGLLLPDADLELIEKAETRVFERFWGKSMTELSEVQTKEIKIFMEEFRELLFRMPFQIPQDFIFLARAVGILSGMCTGLDPDFNVWHYLAPYAKKLLAGETPAEWRIWLNELKLLVELLIRSPRNIDRVIQKLDRGELTVRAPELVDPINRLERAVRSIGFILAFLTFFLAGVQLFLAGYPDYGYGCLSLAIVCLLVGWFYEHRKRP